MCLRGEWASMVSTGLCGGSFAGGSVWYRFERVSFSFGLLLSLGVVAQWVDCLISDTNEERWFDPWLGIEGGLIGSVWPLVIHTR